MGWLAKLFNFVPSTERTGIHLDLRKLHWKVSSPKTFSLPLYLRELTTIVPSDAIVYLEGGTPPQRLKMFFAQRCVPEVSHVEMGTIWPRPQVYHLPATQENILELAGIAEKCAEPEVATHFHVYKNNQVLLQWYDAFFDPIYISKDISEEQIKQFCNKLGLAYQSNIEP